MTEPKPVYATGPAPITFTLNGLRHGRYTCPTHSKRMVGATAHIKAQPGRGWAVVTFRCGCTEQRPLVDGNGNDNEPA